VSWPGVKSELAGLTLAQEASKKGMEVREITRQQTSPRRSSGNKSAA
jgi:hypothetical protein